VTSSVIPLKLLKLSPAPLNYFSDISKKRSHITWWPERSVRIRELQLPVENERQIADLTHNVSDRDAQISNMAQASAELLE